LPGRRLQISLGYQTENVDPVSREEKGSVKLSLGSQAALPWDKSKRNGGRDSPTDRWKR